MCYPLRRVNALLNTLKQIVPAHPSGHAVHPVSMLHAVSGDKHEHTFSHPFPQNPGTQAEKNQISRLVEI